VSSAVLVTASNDSPVESSKRSRSDELADSSVSTVAVATNDSIVQQQMIVPVVAAPCIKEEGCHIEVPTDIREIEEGKLMDIWQGRMAPSGTEPVSKPWHTLEDDTIRCSMIEHIVDALKQRKVGTNPALDCAKRLEIILFQQADSRAEYSDLQTLKDRLQLLARSLGCERAARQSMIIGHGQLGPQSQGINKMPQRCQYPGQIVEGKVPGNTYYFYCYGHYCHLSLLLTLLLSLLSSLSI
jgi:hypothetical protein